MKTMMYSLIATALISITPAYAQQCDHGITKADIVAAQDAWAKSIVAIGHASDPKATARHVIDTLYAYDHGTVLFKPTRAADEQFRETKEEALSYFVGGHIGEDAGFALAPFTNVRFDNKHMQLYCDLALAQGNYYFTPANGQEIKVEYSFGYIRDANGALKINLHHSSMPFVPQQIASR